MSQRMDNPVFANSQSIRQASNEPLPLTLIQFGVEVPLPLDGQIESIRLENDALRDTRPYTDDVCPEATRLQQFYPSVPLDSLKMIRAFTLERPSYYEQLNTALYKYNGSELEQQYVSMVAHFNIGIKALARIHRSPGVAHPSPNELVRLAWIPNEVFATHFGLGNKVVFNAPMSASVALQEQFLKKSAKFQAENVPCVLVFDSRIARQAAMLCQPDNPISAFGTEEDEWTLPAFTRGIITKIEETALESSTGQKVQRLTIKGSRSVTPTPACLQAPTADVLRGALLVSLHTSTGKVQGQSVLLQCVRDLCSSLGSAVCALDPERIQQAFLSLHYKQLLVKLARNLRDWMQHLNLKIDTSLQDLKRDESDDTSVGTDAPCICPRANIEKLKQEAIDYMRPSRISIWKMSKAAAKRCKDEVCEGISDKRVLLMMQLKLKSVSDDEIALAIKDVSFDPKELLHCLDRQFGKWATPETRVLAWTSLLALTEYLAEIIDNDEGVAALFSKPHPPCLTSQYTPLCAMSILGDDFWTNTVPPVLNSLPDAMKDQMHHGWHAEACVDVLRIGLSTTRILFTMGGPDAGKTTFLEAVFGIKTEGGAGMSEECRTKDATFYKHPDFDADTCQAYVADTPGFGDAVQVRNDTVSLVSTCVNVMPGTALVAWITKAERAKLDFDLDSMFQFLLPLCSVIVVTQVDELLKIREQSLFDELEKKGFDLEDEALMQEQRMTLMQDVKDEIEGHLRELCDGNPVPTIVYTVLANNSWASTEPPIGRRRQNPPQGWNSARADVTEFFKLCSGADILARVNDLMGIV